MLNLPEDNNTALVVKIEEKQKGVFLVRPQGRIDSDTYTLLEEKLKPILARPIKALILDMTDLSYISSAGLAVIFNTRKLVESNKASLMLTNLQPQIKKVFDIVKALPAQNIFESIEEADSYLDYMQKKELEKQKDSPI